MARDCFAERIPMPTLLNHLKIASRCQRSDNSGAKHRHGIPDNYVKHGPFRLPEKCAALLEQSPTVQVCPITHEPEWDMRPRTFESASLDFGPRARWRLGL